MVLHRDNTSLRKNFKPKEQTSLRTYSHWNCLQADECGAFENRLIAAQLHNIHAVRQATQVEWGIVAAEQAYARCGIQMK